MRSSAAAKRGERHLGFIAGHLFQFGRERERESEREKERGSSSSIAASAGHWL